LDKFLIFNSEEKHRMSNIYNYSYVTYLQYLFYQLALDLFSVPFLIY